MAYFLVITDDISRYWKRVRVKHYEQWGAMEMFIKKYFTGNYAIAVGPDHSEWTAPPRNPFYATLYCEHESDAEMFKSVFDKPIKGPEVPIPGLTEPINPTNAPPPPSAATWTLEWLKLYPPEKD